MLELPPADRFSDNPTDNLYWNENSWFSVSIPERRIHGLIQHFFRPNMGLLIGGPILWDRTGTSQWNCLYYNWSHLQPIPPGSEKFNLTARNSLSIKILEPLKRYQIGYDQEGFKMDLVWEAIAPHHQMNAAGDAKTYLVQPGRMKGMIRRRDEEFEIDCWSMRDCSSGPYDIEKWPTGGYFWGMGDSGSFLALCIGKKHKAAITGGYLLHDGKTAALASGQRTVLEYGTFGPARVMFEGTDTFGRNIQAIGTVDPGLVFTGYTDHTVVWSLMQWECNGETYWGDNQEFYPAEIFRRIARGEVKLGE